VPRRGGQRQRDSRGQKKAIITLAFDLGGELRQTHAKLSWSAFDFGSIAPISRATAAVDLR